MPDDFTKLDGVGPALADRLRDAGYESYQGIAVAPADTLADMISIGEDPASEIINSARENAEIGGFKSSGEVLDSLPPQEELAFGIEEIDDLLEGGLTTGEMSMLYGSEGSGRRVVAHHLAVRAQLPTELGGLDGKVAYVDTRGSFRPQTVEAVIESLSDGEVDALRTKHNVDGDLTELTENVLEDIRVARVESSDHQLLMEEKIAEMGSESGDGSRVRFIVLDSLPGELEHEFDSDEYIQRNQAILDHYRQIERAARGLNAAALITNRRGSGSGPYGGEVSEHTIYSMLKIKKQSETARELELVRGVSLQSGSRKIRIDGADITPR